MCQVKKLKMLMEQRLHSVVEEIFGLFERTIAEYEEELSRTKEEKYRQQELLDAVFKPQVVLPRADVQQVSAESQEEILSKQQEWSSSVGQKELEPPHIKEEEEELWEQLQRLEEAHDEDEAQSLQLHLSQSDDNRGAELLTQHITADGEHWEDINSEPDNIFAPLSDIDCMSDSSESDHSDNVRKPSENNKNSKDDMRHHADKKRYNCSECGKSFRQKGHFTTHMRIHTGEKPFACSVCPKRFSTKEGLKKHILVHTGEKPYTCSVCSKCFTSKHGMTNHMKSHTEETQFTCPFCPKRYLSKGAMMVHMRIHTGEKPFSCNVCNKRFIYRYQVKRHNCAADLDAAAQCGSGVGAVIHNLEGSWYDSSFCRPSPFTCVPYTLPTLLPVPPTLVYESLWRNKTQ
ncbi:uncharacterized protein [Nerophis lumbriciformis]|uniref:uncharacterized protein isoform X1 n=1 Tax=Nerophis lumbriciformis TaxID=546530 RepID=UPI002ADFFA35|nr:zinc finger protein 599-like isoform X1 [Nerophis lumbriciformis]